MDDGDTGEGSIAGSGKMMLEPDGAGRHPTSRTHSLNLQLSQLVSINFFIHPTSRNQPSTFFSTCMGICQSQIIPVIFIHSTMRFEARGHPRLDRSSRAVRRRAKTVQNRFPQWPFSMFSQVCPRSFRHAVPQRCPASFKEAPSTCAIATRERRNVMRKI